MLLNYSKLLYANFWASLIFTCCLSLGLISCSNNSSHSEQGKMETILTDTQTPEALQFDSIWNARVQKGDTLCLDPATLLSLCPLSLPGYTLEDSSAQALQQDGIYMTQATLTFSKGEKEVTLSVTDYQQNMRVWQSMAQMYKSNYTLNNGDELATQLPLLPYEQFAWLSWIKPNDLVRIQTGIQYRYLLTMDISPVQDTAGCEQLLRALNTSGLTLH